MLVFGGHYWPPFLENEMVMKVLPWGENQGGYVLIEDEDFNPFIHKEYKEKEKEENIVKKRTRKVNNV